jgi:hypothetical protein
LSPGNVCKTRKISVQKEPTQFTHKFRAKENKNQIFKEAGKHCELLFDFK